MTRSLRLALIAILLGCGCTTTVLPVSQTHYSPVSAGEVEVLYQEPQRPHEVIALVTYDAASVFAGIPGIIEKCRQEAAQQGADALVITTSKGAVLGRPATVSGQIIKWK